ncbi:MAG: FecR domain-containing protein [Vicinamibacterales bacterium]
MSGYLRSAIVSAMLLLGVAPVSAQAATPAGHVKTVTGTAFVVREGATRVAKPGDAIFATDTLRTADGSLGVTLQDDTRLSLGANSEVKLDRYVYAPAEGGLGMVLKFVRGVSVYVSGRIAKLAPDAVRLEAPSAIVGVRGTTVAIRIEL